MILRKQCIYAGTDFILEISHIALMFPSVLGCVDNMHTVFSIYIIFNSAAADEVLPIFLSDLREYSNYYFVDSLSLRLLPVVCTPVAFFLLSMH